MMPEGVASPKAWVAWSTSPQVQPPSTWTVRPAGSTRTPRRADRSITSPPSHTPRPAALCPPPRTDTRISCSRATRAAVVTSFVPIVASFQVWLGVGLRRSDGLLGARLVHDMDGRLGGSSEAGEPGLGHQLPRTVLTRLGAERQAAVLRPGSRGAHERRRRVPQLADRVEVVRDAVAGSGLDDHPGAVGRQRRQDVAGGAARVAPVVAAPEDDHQGGNPAP